MKENVRILAIDTSCDETSVAITENFNILSNAISSQVDLHKVWGGVVPDIARRAHQERIDFVIEKAINIASKQVGKKIEWKDIDAIAVTYGPGLAIALEVGINTAKKLANEHNKPLIIVNHLEGHLLSPLAKNSKGEKGIDLDDIKYPALGLIISGKHTEIVLVKKIGDYTVIGETLDDAIGEAFDKIGRMLDLGYPAGPVVTEFAKKGNFKKFLLPIPMHNRKDSLNFSYSGLKTSIYYLIKNFPRKLSKQDIFDIAASFEFSASSHLTEKLEQAILHYKPKSLLVGGGVAASPTIRKNIRNCVKKFELKAYFPSSNRLYMDNAGMIGIVGYLKYLRGEFVTDLDKVDRVPRARMG